MTASAGADQEAQRIDRWLWCARFFKTRSLAAKFVSDGNIQVTRTETTIRIEKASFLIRLGDMLAFSRNDYLRIINILSMAQRRGPAAEAQMLYDDQSPPRTLKPRRSPDPFEREKGAGRPTKRERRALDALKIT
jgi:ribosome-associated heat shock protein Hsp15